MKDLKIFINLTRLNRPIGYLLLFWPCSWGLAYSYSQDNNTEKFLYWIPKSPGWIWLGKRFLFDNPNVNHDFRKIIVKTGMNKGYCCSCMKKCQWINCPNNGNHMDVIRFPRNILDLHKMGYYDLRVLLSEIK